MKTKNVLIKREQSEPVRTAEREKRRAKPNVILSAILLAGLCLGNTSCDDKNSDDPYIFGEATVVFYVDGVKADSAFVSNVRIEAASGAWVARAHVDTLWNRDSESSTSNPVADSSQFTIDLPSYSMSFAHWEAPYDTTRTVSYDAIIRLCGRSCDAKAYFYTAPYYGFNSLCIAGMQIEGEYFKSAKNINFVPIRLTFHDDGTFEFSEAEEDLYQ